MMRHARLLIKMTYAIAVCAAIICAGPSTAQQVPQSQGQMQLSFVPLVKETAPAVVNIYAKIVRPGRSNPFQGDPLFERFFQDALRERPRVQNSLGSGVILSRDGIVVTNYHVVGEATDIRVVLADRREFSAQLVLGDADSDLAILRLQDAKDLPFLPLRASDTVEVGELALAIGNPFGVGQTVSSGIISGLARSGAARGGGRGYFIQTDAPVNPGNSGGALVDMQGQLIGVNTSILSRSGGSNGIGFAIPADLIAEFMVQAKQGRSHFGKPWAGLNGQAVDADMAQAFGFDRPGGVVISSVHPASPFARADVQVGDIIIRIDGQSVNSPSEMLYRMRVAGLGQNADLTLIRDGIEQTVSVVMIEAPDTPPREETVLTERELLEGLRLVRVNPSVIAQYNLPLEARGVLVVEAGPIARRVGLRAGDVIEAINDTEVDRPAAVGALLAERTRGYSIVVLRGLQRLVLQFRV